MNKPMGIQGLNKIDSSQVYNGVTGKRKQCQLQVHQAHEALKGMKPELSMQIWGQWAHKQAGIAKLA